MEIFKFLALIGVIALGGWLKLRYYCKKPYNECSSGEKQLRLVGAAICGACAVASIIAILLSRL